VAVGPLALAGGTVWYAGICSRPLLEWEFTALLDNGHKSRRDK
jgi:hypothetical protein